MVRESLYERLAPLAVIRNRRLNSVTVLALYHVQSVQSDVPPAQQSSRWNERYLHRVYVWAVFQYQHHADLMLPFLRGNRHTSVVYRRGGTSGTFTPISSISAMRPPCYPFLEEVVILGVIYGSLVQRGCNPVGPDGEHTCGCRVAQEHETGHAHVFVKG